MTRLPRPLDSTQIQALRPGTDLFRAVEIQSRMREQHVRAFARQHGEAFFEVPLPPRGKGKPRRFAKYFAVVSQEVVAGPEFGAWRVTYFDERGPIGHGYGRYFMKPGETSNYLGVLRQLIREDHADLSNARIVGDENDRPNRSGRARSNRAGASRWKGNKAQGRHTEAEISKGRFGWTYEIRCNFGKHAHLDAGGTIYKAEAKLAVEEEMNKWDREIDFQGGPSRWR